MLKRTRPRFLTLAISLFSLLLLVLSSCSAQGSPTQPTTANNNTPVKGGTWIDDIPNEPGSLIPNADSQTFDLVVEQAIYSPLFVGDSNGHIMPYAATEIPTMANGDISSDQLTWTIKMRPGMKWNDGQPYNADDVDFTWKLWMNPKFGAASTNGYDRIKSADVSADKLSITFHLKEPFAPFVSLWTDAGVAPLPAHHFASMAPDAIAKSADNLNPSVTNGPFKMSESVPKDHYTVVRDPSYWNAAQGPFLDKVIFRAIGNEDTILKDLQSGQITSSWFLDVSKTTTYKAIQGYNFVVNPNASNFEVTTINLDNPILGKNAEVRKAMLMAIDHNALMKTARKDQALPLCTDHGKAYVPGYQADITCPAFDPAGANALLDQNGWTKGADGVRSKNGQRLEFKYTTTTGKPWRNDDELLIQSNFKDIGIKIDIANAPASDFFGTILPQGKYDLAEFENSWTYDADDSSLASCAQIPTAANSYSGGNYSRYCSQQAEPLFKQETTSADPAVRQDAFNKLHQLYLQDVPFIILYSPSDPGIVKSTGHNYLPGPEGASETVNIWQWWCTNGQC